MIVRINFLALILLTFLLSACAAEESVESTESAQNKHLADPRDPHNHFLTCTVDDGNGPKLLEIGYNLIDGDRVRLITSHGADSSNTWGGEVESMCNGYRLEIEVHEIKSYNHKTRTKFVFSMKRNYNSSPENKWVSTMTATKYPDDALNPKVSYLTVGDCYSTERIRDFLKIDVPFSKCDS